MTAPGSALAEQLRTALHGRPGFDAVEITAIERLKGGYSRRMWSFDVVGADGSTTGWILCTDAEDGVVGADSLSRRCEAQLLDHAFGAGLPVPRIAAVGLADEPFGAGWFVMGRLGGTAAVGPLLRDAEIVAQRQVLGHQKAAILAGIHRLDVQRLPAGTFGPVPAVADVAAIETQRWATTLAHTPTARTETMAAALAWLAAARPAAPAVVTVVHGDYRTGNLLYDRGGIVGVLDWEMAHLGDPLEDVAWAGLAAWRVGTGLVGAMLSDDEWIAAYERSSERPVDREALRFWQVLTGVKMSLLAWRAVERVAPGKEHDLLRSLFEQLQAQLRDNLA